VWNFDGLYSSSPSGQDVLLHFWDEFCEEMPCGLNWECVSMPFGMYIGKDVMESAAEGEAYRRASHALKHE